MRKHYLGLAAWLSAATPFPAISAAGNDLTDLSLSELLDTQITTASRFAEKISDTPATVIVVSREQIETRRYLYLSDLLRDLPGVQLQSKSYEIFYNLPVFRGHTFSNKFLLLQDGMRIDSPTGESLPIAENFPLQHIKQVEIVYGAAAAIYGTDAFGGVINLIAETAADNQGGELSFSGGNDEQRGVAAKVNHRLSSRAHISLSAHRQSADYRGLAQEYPAVYQPVDATTYGGQVIVPAAQREAFVAPLESHSFFGKFEFGNSFSAGFQRNVLSNPSTTGESPAITLYADDLIWKTQTEHAYVKSLYEFSPQLSVENRLEYNGYEIGNQSKFRNIYCEFTDCYIYAKGRKYSLEQQWHYLLGDKHQFIAGFSFADYYSLPKTTDLPRPYDTAKGPQAQGLYHIGTDNTLPIEITELNYTAWAAYFQAQSAWNAQWSSMLGVRYDHGSHYGDTLNPRLGLVFRPTARTVLKWLYGEAFRAPSAMDTSEVYGIFSGFTDDSGKYVSFYFHAPNLNLQPEKARSLEFNALHRLTDEFTTSLSGYYTKLDNMILSINDEIPVQFVPGGSILATESNYNIGSGHRYGLEASLAWQTALTPDWKLDAWLNYSYIDGESEHPSYSFKLGLPYTSTHLAKAGATFKYRNQYFVTLKMRYNSPVYMLSPDPALEHQDTPGSTVFDAHVGIPFDKHFGLTLDVSNLFNRHYYAASTLYPDNAAPQPLRSWLLTLHYRF